MRFIRYGTTYHAEINSAETLREALALDEALWIASAAPVTAFDFDKTFLKLLDCDADGRIKAGELRQAGEWLFARLSTDEGIRSGADHLRKEDLAEGPDRASLADACDKLQSEGTVTLAAVRRHIQEMDKRPVSLGGIMVPDAATDPDLRGFITLCIQATGGVPHPSGETGVGIAGLQAFAETLQAWEAWRETGHAIQAQVGALAGAPKAALDAFSAARDRIDHYFALCDAVRMDPSLEKSFWPALEQEKNLCSGSAAEVNLALSRSPIAPPAADGVLRFTAPINPAFARCLHDVRHEVILPLLDRTDDVLSGSDWNELRTRMDALVEWKSTSPLSGVEGLEDEQLVNLDLDRLLAGAKALIEEGKQHAVPEAALRKLEKLLLYQRNLVAFANNFISFPMLYDPGKRAAFEMGSLVMDGRRFNLAVHVPDRAKHAAVLAKSTMFVMYLKLEHKTQDKTLEVAVPATWGQQGNLCVGKHGVFTHVDGSEWFATVTQLCDNPISLKEAVIDPFKRLGSAITNKIETITAAAEKDLEKTGAETVSKLQQAPAAPPAGGGQASMLAGGGIAIAAVGSSAAFIIKTIGQLGPLQIVQGILGALLAVIVPSTIIAAIRLGNRDLSLLLEGAGWAINPRMRLSGRQKRAFTRTPVLPEGAERVRGRLWYLTAALLLVALLFLILERV